MSWLDDAKSKKKQDDLRTEKEGERKEQYSKSICDPLTPIVQRLLTDLGDAYWGKGQYQIHQMANQISNVSRCFWSADKEIVNGGSYYFGVELLLPNDFGSANYERLFQHYPTAPFFSVRAAESFLTRDTSEASLKEGLIKAFSSGPRWMKP